MRLNDVLVGMTAEQELDSARWGQHDANDVVAECIWLSYGADDISVHSGSVDAANSLMDVRYVLCTAGVGWGGGD